MGLVGRTVGKSVVSDTEASSQVKREAGQMRRADWLHYPTDKSPMLVVSGLLNHLAHSAFLQPLREPHTGMRVIAASVLARPSAFLTSARQGDSNSKNLNKRRAQYQCQNCQRTPWTTALLLLSVDHAGRLRRPIHAPSDPDGPDPSSARAYAEAAAGSSSPTRWGSKEAGRSSRQPCHQ